MKIRCYRMSPWNRLSFLCWVVACFVLGFQCHSTPLLAQQNVFVYPKPAEQIFPVGFEIVDPGGKVIKVVSEYSTANVEAVKEVDGVRHYISDWSLQRYREKGIPPNLMRERFVSELELRRILETANRDLSTHLHDDAKKALSVRLSNRPPASMNLDQQKRLLTEFHIAKEKVIQSEKRMRLFQNGGLATEKANGLEAFYQYQLIVDWNSYESDRYKRLEQVISPVETEISSPAYSDSFPNPGAVGSELEKIQEDVNSPWPREQDPQLERLRNKPHPVLQTGFLEGDVIASEVVGRKFIARTFKGTTTVFVFDAVTGFQIGNIDPEALGYSLRDHGLTPVNLSLSADEKFLVFRRPTVGYGGGVIYIVNLKTWEVGHQLFRFPLLVSEGGALRLAKLQKSKPPDWENLIGKASICSLNEGCDPTSAPVNRASLSEVIARFNRETPASGGHMGFATDGQLSFEHLVEPVSNGNFFIFWPEVSPERPFKLSLELLQWETSADVPVCSTMPISLQEGPPELQSPTCFLGHLLQDGHNCQDPACQDPGCKKDVRTEFHYTSRDGKWLFPVYFFDRGMMPGGYQFNSTLSAYDLTNGQWVALPNFSTTSFSPDEKLSRPIKQLPIVLPGRIDKVNKPHRHHYYEEESQNLWISTSLGELLCLDLKGRKVLKKVEGISTFQVFGVQGDFVLGIPDVKIPMMELWSHQTGKLLFRIYPDSKGDVLAVAPEGYYASRGSAGSRVIFRVGDRGFRLDQYDALYNRPDKIMQSLKGARTGQIEFLRVMADRRRDRLERNSGGENRLPPEVVFQSEPAVENGIFAATVSVKGTAPKDCILTAKINGVPVWSVRPDRETTAVSFPLAAGDNLISITATSGGISSIPLNSRFELPATVARTRYIVSLGVSRYAEEEWNLEFAAKDAHDLTAALHEFDGEVKQLVLTDDQVSLAAFDTIRDFLKESNINDEVIFFVAGHGLLDTEWNYYFAPHDMDFSAPAKQGISIEFLEDLMAGSASLRKLLLIDTCHAGYIDREESQQLLELTQNTSASPRSGDRKVSVRSSGPGIPPQAGAVDGPAGLSAKDVAELREFFPDFTHSRGISVFAASAGAEFAFEGKEARNGLFTHAVISTLRDSNSDLNRDGAIQISELISVAAEKVKKLSEGLQHPTTRGSNPSLDFGIVPKPDQ
ncbi:MAG: caspase family protein [Verrucomicrobiales bacterium]|nr:caspase family protein [Verrucomicrobiales bacterium]